MGIKIINTKQVWLHRLVLDPGSGHYIPPLSLHTVSKLILTLPNPSVNIISLDLGSVTVGISARIESARLLWTSERKNILKTICYGNDVRQRNDKNRKNLIPR